MPSRRRSSIRETSPRKLQKAETHRRLLAAASELFAEEGYEQTTVKDIAKRAEVAVGSVFAHFASKSELLTEILIAHAERQAYDMRAADPGEGQVIDRMVAALRINYRAELERVELVAVMRAYSWSWPKATEARFAAHLRPAIDVLARIVEDAKAIGEFRADLDVQAFLDVVVSAHFANFRHALFQPLSEDDLCARLRRQLETLIAGAQAA